MIDLKFAHGAVLAIVLLSLGACAGSKPNPSSTGNQQALCSEPRPQVCTADYRPVCAEQQNGELKTYSNACSACGDASVASHREGACE